MIEHTIIGRAVTVDFPKHGIVAIPAKIDTGADSSSIWASNIIETADGLNFCLVGEGSPFFTGNPIYLTKEEYDTIWIANSFGHREIRYRIKLSVRVEGRLLKGTFTLANRAEKPYPILLGRRLLAGKFLVDVKQGKLLSREIKAKQALLKDEMESRKGENL